jgi:hypothetical protein
VHKRALEIYIAALPPAKAAEDRRLLPPAKVGFTKACKLKRRKS